MVVPLTATAWIREVPLARVFVSHAGEDVALADEVRRWPVPNAI
jgi:hypothetical protein